MGGDGGERRRGLGGSGVRRWGVDGARSGSEVGAGEGGGGEMDGEVAGDEEGEDRSDEGLFLMCLRKLDMEWSIWLF